MNRKTFFATLKTTPLFSKTGGFLQEQVDGVDAVIDAVEEHGDISRDQFSYIMATVYHETARRMAPVRESLAKTDEGAIAALRRAYGHKAYLKRVNDHVYYGRGFVQLTWSYNYRAAGEKLGINLYDNPDLAMEPRISAKILVRGMMEGWFTTKALPAYVANGKRDFINARRVVNGTDKAKLIAGYVRWFDMAAKAAGYGKVPTFEDAETPIIPKPATIEAAKGRIKDTSRTIQTAEKARWWVVVLSFLGLAGNIEDAAQAVGVAENLTGLVQKVLGFGSIGIAIAILVIGFVLIRKTHLIEFFRADDELAKPDA